VTRLHGEVRGRGERLVLLHGWGLNLRVWDTLAERLSTRCEVMAFDLPGHGRSPWDAAKASLEDQASAVLDSIGADTPVTLLGWSFGGQLALQAAALAPQRIARLVLIAATPSFVARPDWTPGASTALLHGLGQNLGRDYRRTVTEFLELQVRGSADAHGVLMALREALFSHGEARPEALAAGLALLEATDLRPLLPSIGHTTLVVAGQYDRVTPPAASRALAQQLRNARFIELRRAAHAPFLSHPDAFSDEVCNFMNDECTIDANE
jgi:pimeloyl-[acyl-carrier protein] methyl ester esterase